MVTQFHCCQAAAGARYVAAQRAVGNGRAAVAAQLNAHAIGTRASFPLMVLRSMVRNCLRNLHQHRDYWRLPQCCPRRHVAQRDVVDTGGSMPPPEPELVLLRITVCLTVRLVEKLASMPCASARTQVTGYC
jgi:hypothetical protein